jgi:hypothetical protein
VRRGKDERLPKDKDGRRTHTLANVYSEMIYQICSDYPGLPDARDLTQTEIRLFYEANRSNLHERTKPR